MRRVCGRRSRSCGKAASGVSELAELAALCTFSRDLRRAAIEAKASHMDHNPRYIRQGICGKEKYRRGEGGPLLLSTRRGRKNRTPEVGVGFVSARRLDLQKRGLAAETRVYLMVLFCGLILRKGCAHLYFSTLEANNASRMGHPRVIAAKRWTTHRIWVIRPSCRLCAELMLVAARLKSRPDTEP